VVALRELLPYDFGGTTKPKELFHVIRPNPSQ
jgi:hypothetical protein